MARVFPLLALSWAACEPVLEGPTPALGTVEPSLVCTEQLDTVVTVTGAGLAPVAANALNEAELVLPQISLTVRTALVDGVGSFEVDEAWASADAMRFTVSPSLGLVPGTYDVAVQNPDGQRSTLEGALGAVGAPAITGFSPDPACGGPSGGTVTAEGVNFVSVGAALPEVRVDGNTVPVDSVDGCVVLGVADASVCTSLTFSLPGGVPLGTHEVTVTNPAPAACATSTPATLTVGPPPTLLSAVPDSACGEVSGLVLTGTTFRPDSTVTIDGLEPDAVNVVDATTITVSVASLSLGIGDHEVVVSTPDGCTSNTTTFTVFAPPAVASVAPDQTCDASALLTVSGAGFANGDVVTIDGADADTTFGDAATLQADLASVALAPGDHAVAVRSADGCTSNDVTFTLDPAPTVTSAAPTPVCGAGGSLTVLGTGFVNGMEVSLDGVPAQSVTFVSATEITATFGPLGLTAGAHDLAVASPNGCAAEVLSIDVSVEPDVLSVTPDQTCDSGATLTLDGLGFALGDVVTIDGVDAPTTFVDAFTLEVDLAGVPLATGAHVVAVRTADGCTSGGVPFTLDPAPTIASVSPATTCDVGNVFTITGTGFVPGMDVSLDGLPADSVSFVSATQITASFGPTGVGPGAHDLAVRTPDGCGATALAAVTIPESADLLLVDPSFVYNGLDTPIVLYTSGVLGTISRVWVASDPGGVETDLTFDATDPGAILATVPSGLAAGAYDVFVQEASVTCPSVLVGGLTVTEDLTVAIGGVSPDHIWEEAFTNVVVALDQPVLPGDVPFQDVPDVYLVSSVGDAIRLVNVRFDSTTQLTLRVPFVPAGVYDILVVNPDGSVGLLDSALTSTADPPPSVNTVSPPSVPASGTPTVVIRGFDFRTPSVSLTCRDPVTAVETTAAAPVVTNNPLSINVTVPTATLGEGICRLTVQNLDGSSVDWPSFAITDPTARLADFAAGPSMLTARRAPAVAVARATPTERFLYAVGGDDGAVAGALSSVEYAPVDAFWQVWAWRAQVNDLPEPRTLAGMARIGRYLYVVGGNDGLGPVDTVWRAQVLDPASSPQYDSHVVDVGGGLARGRWMYRVSALFDPLDPYNPGESLASEPVVIRAPEGATVTLVWNFVFGATGYRVYRTPGPDAASGTEQLVAELGNVLAYEDDGSAVPVPTEVPLPMGSLGEWAVLPSLPGPTESPAVTAAFDPADPAFAYVYVAGGSDGAQVLDAIHSLDVIQFDEFTQDYGAWVTSAEVLPTAVTEAAAWPADAFLHPIVGAGNGYIYVGGGRTTLNGAATGAVSFAEVISGGTLGPITATSTLSPGRAGFAVASASGRVFAIGGAGAAPTADGRSADVTASGALNAWTGTTPTTTVSRYLAGAAQESGVLYLVGGDDGTGATATIDQSQL